LGNEDIAREYVNKIRRRVKLPDIITSGEELFKDIMHERRIELCFEDQRFFDVKRWMIADQTDNKDIYGIEWKKFDEDGNLSSTGTLHYNLIHVQKRYFHDRMYYLPIPLSEIEKSNLLEQNSGYSF
jgi:starch-binding outer membrane protein, SusD/RagB family